MDPSTSILIAEDNPDDALLLQRAFKSHGTARPPHIVPDGAAAIEYLNGAGPFQDRVVHPFPNLVILDLKMPKVSGFDVLEWLNDHPDFKVIPTIIWSSSSDPRDVKHAFCLGANAYLCKPFGYQDYVRLVGNLLTFWSDCLKPPVGPSVPMCETLEGSLPFSGSHH